MSNELKEMLQSVIHEALQPVIERLDKLEARFDSFEAFTREKFDQVDIKLDAISEQVAANSKSIVELKEQRATNEDYAVQIKSINARLDELTLDVKVLKKAI